MDIYLNVAELQWSENHWDKQIPSTISLRFFYKIPINFYYQQKS